MLVILIAVNLLVHPALGGGPKTGNMLGSTSALNSAQGKKAEGMLHPGDDPHSPHAQGFEPRPGPGEGGSIWDFGHVHAALHHVLGTASEGDAANVFSVLQSFSKEHGLGVVPDTAQHAVEAAVRSASAAAGLSLRASQSAALRAPQINEQSKTADGRGLRMLVLQAGMGSFELESLPLLLRLEGSGTRAHEVVSVESDPHMSDARAQIFGHALGTDREHKVMHTPILPGDDTSLSELLGSLQETYEMPSFDLIVLEGIDRQQQEEQIKEIIRSEAVHNGTVVHAVGPARDDASTARYLEMLSNSKQKFTSEVHDLADGSAAVISTLHWHDLSEL